MASLLALVKRKSRQRFLQTPGKTNYNNVTALFSLFYFPEMLVGGGGRGRDWWTKMVWVSTCTMKSQNVAQPDGKPSGN